MKDDTSHVIAVINALSDSENQRYSVLVYWSSKFKSSRDLRSDSHKHPEKEFKISIFFAIPTLKAASRSEIRPYSLMRIDASHCINPTLDATPRRILRLFFLGLNKGVIVYVKHGCKLGNSPRKKNWCPKNSLFPIALVLWHPWIRASHELPGF